MSLSLNIDANAFAETGRLITPDHFGIVQTGFGAMPGFSQQFSAMSGGHLRWPGGTLSEVQTNVYGLDVPGLFDATQLWNPDPSRDRPDLADMFNYARAEGVGLSIQIPTARYANDISLGQQHLDSFLKDLSAGTYGVLPDELQFEIGNEFYALPEFQGSPESYGQLANEFLTTIDAYLSSPEGASIAGNLQIGIQMGRTQVEDRLVRAEIDAENFGSIDFLIAHHLPFRHEAIDKPEWDYDSGNGVQQVSRIELLEAQLAEWDTQVRMNDPNGTPLEYHLTGWTIGDASNLQVNDLNYQDYGARQASAAAKLLAEHISIGVAAANVWGVDVSNPNSFSKMENGSIVMSAGGEAFKLMSESLVGTRLLEGFDAFDRDTPVTMFSYRDIDTLTVLLSANDIPDAGLEVDLNLDNFGTVSDVVIDRITYSYLAGMPFSASDPESRQYEIPNVASSVQQVNGTDVTISLSQDYEFVRLVFDLDSGSDPVQGLFGFLGSSLITVQNIESNVFATTGKNTIKGTQLDDLLVGGVGSDLLQGGSGADILIGDISSMYFGNDVLAGGAGDDIMEGGGGSDTFVFRPNGGHDIIADVLRTGSTSTKVKIVGSDFDPNQDSLMFLGFGYETQADAFAHIQDINGVATFINQGTTIEFIGLTTADLDQFHGSFL